MKANEVRIENTHRFVICSHKLKCIPLFFLVFVSPCFCLSLLLGGSLIN